ncbi:hypothetical protein IWQ61_005920 [Dispira simplex]|nr:hypothetical protein IWQ61_005920 [Dispira simplex]
MANHDTQQNEYNSSTAPTNDANDVSVDTELEAMRQRVKEMEEEAAKLRTMQEQVEKELKQSAPVEAKEEVDSRSVYVGNVDYSTTPEELQAHFQSCGLINRVTILCNKLTGHPKGYAYVEFADADAITQAVTLSETELHGRAIKVTPKRTNLPGLRSQRGGFRGRRPFRGGYRGRGYYRGHRGYAPY